MCYARQVFVWMFFSHLTACLTTPFRYNYSIYVDTADYIYINVIYIYKADVCVCVKGVEKVVGGGREITGTTFNLT